MKANSRTLSFSIHIFKQSFKPSLKRPRANLLDSVQVSVRLQRAVNLPPCFCLPLPTCQNWINSLSEVPSAILSAQNLEPLNPWKESENITLAKQSQVVDGNKYLHQISSPCSRTSLHHPVGPCC